ncbi:hypothetical protein EYF80_045006 [Liparis tanakae]|uniref:Uncharacterized protein n=1 Tax=Liparis tanakae TaxID=230148 RepID=A0A4Z2FW30_9TELE|nr:hypothetical protein EYF80_045006 [Liparis tanakae]
MGSSWSARKPSRRCMRCFSPRELMGMTPMSTTTTTPTISTTLVTSGTRSRASCSEPSSSTTTTSRLVHRSKFTPSGPLTSAGVGELGPAQEAQVSSPSPDALRVPEAQPGGEVVRLQRLVPVDGEVPAGVVAAVHPDLQNRGNRGNRGTRATGRVNERLHERQAVRGPPLHQADPADTKDRTPKHVNTDPKHVNTDPQTT